MGHKARDSGGKFVLFCRCTTILAYCPVRDWTWICYVIGFENIRIRLSTRYRIRCGFIFFPLWRADLTIFEFAVEFTGCVWTVAVSEKKKLRRIQKYPDTCGPGLIEAMHYFVLTRRKSLFFSETMSDVYTQANTLDLVRPIRFLE